MTNHIRMFKAFAKPIILSLCIGVAASGTAEAIVAVKTAATATATTPTAAAQYGYNVDTFSVTSFSNQTVDINKTYGAGYKLYLWNFFGGSVDKNSVKFNADGSVTLSGTAANMNNQLATAALPANKADFFHGVGFGGGA